MICMSLRSIERLMIIMFFLVTKIRWTLSMRRFLRWCFSRNLVNQTQGQTYFWSSIKFRTLSLKNCAWSFSGTFLWSQSKLHFCLAQILKIKKTALLLIISKSSWSSFSNSGSGRASCSQRRRNRDFGVTVFSFSSNVTSATDKESHVEARSALERDVVSATGWWADPLDICL